MTAEEKIQRIKDFRPIDDVFFEIMADDTEVCQEILRVIMDDNKLIVDEVIVQSSKKNIYGRSVRLDALCYLSSGKRVNIEVQRSDNDNHLKRARFNSASITVKESTAGKKFAEIVDVYIVYISEFDIFHGNSPIYHIDKVIRETGERIDDGSSEIFVNTAINDGSDLAELMACFTQKYVQNPKFPKLSSRVKMLKTTEGGASAVCEIMEKYQAEAVKEAEKEASIRTTIQFGHKYNISKANLIEELISNYGLSESEAHSKYAEYAPILK